MEKTYNPELIEQKYRELWEKGDLFSSSANSSSRDAFSIVLPPPNVTGSLHMGHAFQHTIMDVYTRYNRSKGNQTLWQPGTDHAGIATQMVVERQLSMQNISRHDLGREKFTDTLSSDLTTIYCLEKAAAALSPACLECATARRWTCCS